MQREYADISARLSAIVIDGLMHFGSIVLLWPVLFVLGGAVEPGGSGLVRTLASLLFILMPIGLVWFAIWNTIYRMGKTGQSLGRKATHIAVLDAEGSPIGFGRAFLRETVGRFVSGIALGIGYLNFFRDNDRQTWHDKMVDSYVYSVPENFSADEERFAEIGSGDAQ